MFMSIFQIVIDSSRVFSKKICFRHIFRAVRHLCNGVRDTMFFLGAAPRTMIGGAMFLLAAEVVASKTIVPRRALVAMLFDARPLPNRAREQLSSARDTECASHIRRRPKMQKHSEKIGRNANRADCDERRHNHNNEKKFRSLRRLLGRV
jgi:hypothetical protein